jgi:hypothetical protein
MDEAEFERELRRLEAIAESYEANMYEAPDPSTAAGHYAGMKDAFSDAIGLARRAGRSDHVERLEKRLSEVKQIFRNQLSFDGGWTRSHPGPSSERRTAAVWIVKIKDFIISVLCECTIPIVFGLMIEAYRRVATIRRAPSVLRNAAQKALKTLRGDMMFRELDVVEIIKLLTPDRPYTGTEGVCRSPQVGDTGTIVSVLSPDEPNMMYYVECVDNNGLTVWLAGFWPEELRRLKAWP